MLVKKLLFAPLFLSLVLTLTYLFKFVLVKHLEVFMGKWGGLYELGIIALIILLTSLSYCLYLTFTQDVKYYLGLAALGSLIPFIFLELPLALIAAIAFFISFSLAYFNLQTNLKTYINFQPTTLLSGPIRTLCTLLLFSLTIVFYFNSNSIIQTQGFKIPEPIVDWAIDLSLQGASPPQVQGKKYLAQIPTLTQEQINLLKENPQLLRDFGLDPSDLDQLTPQTTTSPQNSVKTIPSLPTANIRDIIKTQITNSLDQMVKPYIPAIPLVLALMLYSLTSFALWILFIFLNPLISLIFYIFEKSGFIKFEKEMREVRKIVL